MNVIHKLFVSLTFLLVFSISHVFGDPTVEFLFKSNAQYRDVVVKEVLSVNKIVLEETTGGRPETIELIGLRFTEPPATRRAEIKRDQYGFAIKEPVNPLTPVEDRAFEFVNELLVGRHVRLEFDAEKKSEDYNTLAYVFLLADNTFVNTEILRHGFADLSIQAPNLKYADQLREAYKEARSEKRGLQGE